jgi:hypothetical protein
MTPCGSYKNRRFGGSYRLHLQGARVRAGTERSSKLLYRQRLVEYKYLKSYNVYMIVAKYIMVRDCCGRRRKWNPMPVGILVG